MPRGAPALRLWRRGDQLAPRQGIPAGGDRAGGGADAARRPSHSERWHGQPRARCQRRAGVGADALCAQDGGVHERPQPGRRPSSAAPTRALQQYTQGRRTGWRGEVAALPQHRLLCGGATGGGTGHRAAPRCAAGDGLCTRGRRVRRNPRRDAGGAAPPRAIPPAGDRVARWGVATGERAAARTGTRRGGDDGARMWRRVVARRTSVTSLECTDAPQRPRRRADGRRVR
mmetsp:Transcript_30494/g.79184  ORF Transcript_30494/g.79184 Transcript_30494/m.79184 type:complete len:230 (+) Transcript_30494:611-1300(+)